jgi:hypothetical protein
VTTPVPTTAAAHLAIVEALRDIGDVTGDGRCGACSWAVEVCDAGRSGQKRCRGRDARAGLATWEQREPLRNQPALFHAVVAALVRTRDEGGATSAIVILNALEPLLFGTGREAPPAYGVLMCSECGCSSDNAKACNRDCPCHRTGPRTGGGG